MLEVEVEERVHVATNEEGKVVEEEKRMVKRNLTMNIGEKFTLPSTSYHSIYTVSNEPSCYVYIYLNRTASVLDGLLGNYLINMESFYNNTLKKIDQSSSEREEKALNLTLEENSKHFFRMLINRTELVKTDQEEEQINQKLIEIDRLFIDNKLNKTKIYNDFVDKFHSFMSEQEKTERNSKENLFGKIKRKLNSNWSRFKQR